MENYTLYANSIEYSVKMKSSEKLFGLLMGIRSPSRYHHCIRVSSYAGIIGGAMGMSRKQVRCLKIAGLIHDIGFSAINDNILEKRTALTPDEYAYIQLHPIIGMKILDCYGFPQDIMKAVVEHHEAFDGSGYPLGLKREQIGIYGKILFLSEYFDTITTDTPYKNASSIDEAIQSVKQLSNKKFDPELVDTLLNSEEISHFYMHKESICKNYPVPGSNLDSIITF